LAPTGRFPVVFDETAWAQDLRAASSQARAAASAARAIFERAGIQAGPLKKCGIEHGSDLRGCVKVYVGAGGRLGDRDDPWGMVLEGITRPSGRPALQVIGFGRRHPTDRDGRPARTPTVYDRAHRRRSQ